MTGAKTLRAARIAEAKRRHVLETRPLVEHLADLYETNWTPPVVDPDLLAAREWCKSKWPATALAYTKGRCDAEPEIRAYLAGCTRGREGATGLVEALDRYANALSAHPYSNDETKWSWSALLDALASAKRGGRWTF